MQADFHPNSVLTRSFSQEMTTAAACFKAGGFDPGQKDVIARLAKVMANDGPHPAHAHALNEWRQRKQFRYKRVLFRYQQQAVRGAEGVLAATGEYDPAKPHQLTASMRTKIASLCLAQHLHFEEQYGAHQVWVLDLPNKYQDWPSRQIATANLAHITDLILQSKGLLNAKHREQLAQAVNHAAAYAEKAHSMLAQAAPGNAAWKKVAGWFADEKTTDAMLKEHIGTMLTGLRKMIAVLRSNKIVLLDHPQLRGEVTERADLEMKNSEAFVFTKFEPVTVIYVQKAFADKNPVIQGPRNFARIMIHEVAHREAKTIDRYYATNGIRPSCKRLPFATIVRNCDSWAFCVLDLADMLTPLEIARARIN